jgi:hypothetical protein
MLKNDIHIYYTNWKHQTGWRHVVPIGIRFGFNQFHHKDQWLLVADDLDKKEVREYAMQDIHRIVSADEWALGTAHGLEEPTGVKIPTTSDEAVAMMMIATSWLHWNAPERLNSMHHIDVS